MSARYVLGVEIGGTKLQLGLGRGDGRVVALERRKIDPGRGAEGILRQIAEIYPQLLASAGLASGDVAALGVGFGGPVDARRGVVTTSHQVDGWDRFPLADWVRSRLGVGAVTLGNDADTAALAEARFGAGVGRSPVLYLTVGSGIGGGLVIDGQVYRGAGAGAVEIGHLQVIDGCGVAPSVTPLEQAASGWAIGGAARRHAERLVDLGLRDWPPLLLAGGDPSAITTEHVAAAARDGDPESRAILEKATRALAWALAQAVTLLAPARIILGGGVSLIGEDLWLGPIRRELASCVFPPFRGTYDLVGADLGESVVVQGALALARDLSERDAPRGAATERPP